mgnify:CR=1 FL=1
MEEFARQDAAMQEIATEIESLMEGYDAKKATLDERISKAQTRLDSLAKRRAEMGFRRRGRSSMPCAMAPIPLAARFAGALLVQPLPVRSFLNINVPTLPARGVRVTSQARRNHVTNVARRVDPRQRPYFWIDEGQNEWEPHDRSDYQAVRDGYVSITPLQPDLTDHSSIELVERLTKDLGSRVR